MPQDVVTTLEEKPEPEPTRTKTKTKSRDASWQWFTTPPAIKRLFDKFPLQTHSVNELPWRTAEHRDRNALYIFTTKKGAENGAPSFNPGCLKWQAYLRFQGIDFVTVSSNNHASPTGALPFLLPSAGNAFPHADAAPPVPSNHIQRWTREVKAEQSNRAGRSSTDERNKDAQTGHQEQATEGRGGRSVLEDASDMRYEAYMSLLDYRIRNTYLYSLYLSRLNFTSVAAPLYINPNSTNTPVRQTLSHQLRSAAESELLKQSPTIDVGAMYRDCNKAFEALSGLLGEDEYFFGKRGPGLFDASVFAYTNVLLDDDLQWKDATMKDQMRGYQNLVDHRGRIAEIYFA